MVPIQKGIEIPDKQTRRMTYPWNVMDVGDCFDLQSKVEASGAHINAANKRYALKRFISRVVSLENGTRIRRCWRVE